MACNSNTALHSSHPIKKTGSVSICSCSYLRVSVTAPLPPASLSIQCPIVQSSEQQRTKRLMKHSQRTLSNLANAAKSIRKHFSRRSNCCGFRLSFSCAGALRAAVESLVKKSHHIGTEALEFIDSWMFMA